MKPLVLFLMVGVVVLPGCGHTRAIRPVAPMPEAAANDPKPEPRVINGESQAVQNWSTGDR